MKKGNKVKVMFEILSSSLREDSEENQPLVVLCTLAASVNLRVIF